MTDRKPALKQYTDFENGGKVILASDIPAAILNATKAELAALAVFAEAMPELLEVRSKYDSANTRDKQVGWENAIRAGLWATLKAASDAALAAAKEAEHE